MLRVDREHQTVEEAPAFRGRTGKQRIHLRREPHDAQVIGKGGRGCGRLAVDPAFARERLFAAVAHRDSRAERGQPEHALDLGGSGPRSVAFAEGNFVEGCASQATAGGEKGDGLDEVGLARPIGADQHDGPGCRLHAGGAIAAKVCERETANEGGGHWATRVASGEWRIANRARVHHAPACYSPLAIRYSPSLTPASASAHRWRRRRRDPGSKWGNPGRRA